MFEIKENISLKNYNSFGLDVKTYFFVECFSIQDIVDFLNIHQDKDLPLMILGGGSNILFSKDFEGYVLRPSIKGIDIVEENEKDVVVRVGAGEDWDEFVNYCVEREWGGIENLSLIPGNIGTCPIQNIGAYGVEVKDVITKVEALDIESLSLISYANSECNFGYRDSVFKTTLKGKQIVTHVTFKLKKQPEFKLDYGNLVNELKRFEKIDLKSIRQAVIDIRECKLPDPEDIGNAGSFFKNPIIGKETFEKIKIEYPNIPNYDLGNDLVKIPAGWLIEKAGYKGRRDGNTGVHEQQALVLVNYGNATGEEILHLARNIQQTILILFGIMLEMEVNII
jgi:UDP-N-acetylmuramate dehydrogenase